MFTGAKGLYSSVSPTNIQSLLNFYQRVTGVPCPQNETQDIGIHATIIYSKVAPKASPAYLRSLCIKDEFEAKIVCFEYWSGHDNAGYLVAVLDSRQLSEQNALWITMGATPSFDKYKPHITLAEGANSKYHQNYLAQLNSGLHATGSIPITMGQEVIDDLKNN